MAHGLRSHCVFDSPWIWLDQLSNSGQGVLHLQLAVLSVKYRRLSTSSAASLRRVQVLPISDSDGQNRHSPRTPQLSVSFMTRQATANKERQLLDDESRFSLRVQTQCLAIRAALPSCSCRWQCRGECRGTRFKNQALRSTFQAYKRSLQASLAVKHAVAALSACISLSRRESGVLPSS